MPSGLVQTTDATVTTVFTAAPADGKVHAVTAKIIGKKTDGSQAARYDLEFLVRRSGATTTLVGMNRVVEIEDDSTWNADIDVNGTDFRVRMTGVVGATIDWVADIDVR